MFPFTDYIDIRAFFISLFLGIMISYILAPHKKYIIAYPNPENAHEKIYENDSKDSWMPTKSAGARDTVSCVKYQSQEVSCPQDPNVIQQIGMPAPKTEEKDAVMKTLRSVLYHDS